MVLEIKNITQELIDKLNAATVEDNNVCRGKYIDIDWSCMEKEDGVQLAHVMENLGEILQTLKDAASDGSGF